MRRVQWWATMAVLGGVLPGGVVAIGRSQSASAPPPVTVQDCNKLKGGAKKDCIAHNGVAQDGAAGKGTADKAGAAGSGTGKRTMDESTTGERTTGEPDPPASSMKPHAVPGRDDDTPNSHNPLHMPGQDADVPGSEPGSSSSSSSSNDNSLPPPPDDDAPPTTAGSDTPIKPGTLKDLGARVDSTAARQKLEQTRVEDDLRVGRFYFKDGNYAGATARYQDALSHDADNPDAHFGLAEVLVKQNRTADAVVHLERYLQLAPDDDHTRDAQKMLARLRR